MTAEVKCLRHSPGNWPVTLVKYDYRLLFRLLFPWAGAIWHRQTVRLLEEGLSGIVIGLALSYTVISGRALNSNTGPGVLIQLHICINTHTTYTHSHTHGQPHTCLQPNVCPFMMFTHHRYNRFKKVVADRKMEVMDWQVPSLSTGFHAWCYILLCPLPPLCLPPYHWSICSLFFNPHSRFSCITSCRPWTLNQTWIPVRSGQYLIVLLSPCAPYFTQRCAAFLTKLSWRISSHKIDSIQLLNRLFN